MMHRREGKIPVGVLVTVGIVASVAILATLPPRTNGARPGGTSASVATSASTPDSVPADSPKLAAPGDADPPVGEFYYLVDVSASTKEAGVQTPFEEGVALLQPIFGAIRDVKELSPQRHRVATIGALSLSAAPRCDIYVAPQTLFSADTNVTLATRTMLACEREFRALTPEQHTDISGALVNAGLSLQGQRKAMRGIVIVSDLDEDTAPGTVAGRPDLRGMCVAIYTLVTPQAARDPSILAARGKEWNSRLREWGARDVYVANARGFDAADLKKFFRGCEG
jgi:hypothetical protein